MRGIWRIIVASLVASGVAEAGAFSSFTPLASNVAAGSLPEAAPFALASPAWTQTSIASRATQVSLGVANSGTWDMIDTNRTGADAGRYLFMGFENSQAGIQRTDLVTGSTETIWQSPTAGSFVSFDAARWTPWGTHLTAEESWRPTLADTSRYGRLFELTDPLAAPGTSGLPHRNIIPRVSHEGLAFDRDSSLYYIDEFNGGCIYKFVSATPTNGATFFDAGVNYVLRVGDGSTPGATGNYSWVPFTAADGSALPGALEYTDLNGVTSVDARFTTDLPAFRGTDFMRPEDIEIQTLGDGSQRLYVATTSTHQVFSLDLTGNVITECVSRGTLDAATGLAVGGSFTNPDNIGIDSLGNIYIVEDQPGGQADIWFVTDADRDGVAESIGRWASLSTIGAEPSGLFFDPFDPTRCWINVQHPASGDDRLIQISAVPEPLPALLAAIAGLGGLMWRRRRRQA
jgi:secreted PhoX family phosphatase